MTEERIRETLARYREQLLELGAAPQMMDMHHRIDPAKDRWPVFNHCLAMISEMEQLLAAGKREKVDRWLGWMQGALAVFGVYTINEERDHNRS